MPLRTYNPKKVVVVIGGFPMGGWADGQFLNISRATDAYTKHVGAGGDTSRAKSNDRSGEATLTFAQTSPSNDVLSGFATADEISDTGVVSFTVKDLSGRSTYVSGFAWIRKVPDGTFDKEITDREWILDLTDLDVFTGGNLQAE